MVVCHLLGKPASLLNKVRFLASAPCLLDSLDCHAANRASLASLDSVILCSCHTSSNENLRNNRRPIINYQVNCRQPRQHNKNQRHCFANKDLSSQGCFSSGHVCTWELDCEESWAPRNWCFWTVVLEKILESPLDYKEIQPVHPKGDQSWVCTRRADVEAETPILWPLYVKSWVIGKDPDAGKDWRREKRTTENEMVGWHHRQNGHGFG